MDINLIVTLILALAALGLLVGGPILLFRRAARLNTAQEAEAAAFERQVLASAQRAGGEQQVPPAEARRASSPAARRGQAYPAFGGEPTVASPPSAPLPEAGGNGMGEPGTGKGAPPDLARSIVEKLSVAGVFKSVEGPLRCANPDIRGTLISLKNGKRLGVLESEFDEGDPALDGLMRHLDGLIVMGPEGQAFFLKRFQDFLSDLIAL